LHNTVCSKCYNADEQDSEKKKFSMKGMSKRQNNITWQCFKAALNSSTDRAKDRGFLWLTAGWPLMSSRSWG